MMRVKSAAHAVAPRLYARVRTLYGQLNDRLFDARLRVDTTGRPDEGADQRREDSIEYRPTPIHVLQRVFGTLSVQPDDVFLELGAGKGRVVLEAAQRPFRRVIGVEIAESLSRQARRNVRQAASRLACKSVEIVHADAASFTIPDDVTIIYLYNPFEGETFRTAIGNVLASIRRRPRRLRLIYCYPTMHDALVQRGFRVTWKEPPAVPTDGTLVDGQPCIVAAYELDGATIWRGRQTRSSALAGAPERFGILGSAVWQPAAFV